jgi:hypothetical protein
MEYDMVKVSALLLIIATISVAMLYLFIPKESAVITSIRGTGINLEDYTYKIISSNEVFVYNDSNLIHFRFENDLLTDDIFDKYLYTTNLLYTNGTHRADVDQNSVTEIPGMDEITDADNMKFSDYVPQDFLIDSGCEGIDYMVLSGKYFNIVNTTYVRADIDFLISDHITISSSENRAPIAMVLDKASLCLNIGENVTENGVDLYVNSSIQIDLDARLAIDTLFYGEINGEPPTSVETVSYSLDPSAYEVYQLSMLEMDGMEWSDITNTRTLNLTFDSDPLTGLNIFRFRPFWIGELEYSFDFSPRQVINATMDSITPTVSGNKVYLSVSPELLSNNLDENVLEVWFQ